MIYQRLTKLILVCYHKMSKEKAIELRTKTGGQVIFSQGSNTSLNYGSMMYCCVPHEVTEMDVGRILTETLLVQCKTNAYYFTDEERAALIELTDAVGGKSVLVHKLKERGKLVYERVAGW
jgi:hypothetical protein